jgi:predicted dehydrogenase
MAYPRGLAVAEGSWTQIGDLTSYQTAIYGTRGTLFVEPHGGRLLLATSAHPAGNAVEVPAAPFLNAPACFRHCLETDTPFPELCQDRVGRDAQEILQAGLLAADRNAAVSLPLSRAEGA